MSKAPVHYQIDDLLYVMARLRDPVDGCPWDLEQTFNSIVPSTLEECYELADAIEQQDIGQIREELGDVLFQVIFYSQLGKDQSLFEFEQVVDNLTAKLIRRHPHVFPGGDMKARMGPDNALDEQQIKANWEQIKQVEREGKTLTGVLDDIPVALPAMTRSVKLQKRASRVGFDWPDWQAVIPKLEEELAELKQALEEGDKAQVEAELGDLFFAMANLARKLKVDPETALRGTNQRFEQRFRFIESQLQQQGRSLEEASLLEMDQLWEQAKRQLAKEQQAR